MVCLNHNVFKKNWPVKIMVYARTVCVLELWKVLESKCATTMVCSALQPWYVEP